MDTILILDFGSQTTQLIGSRIRDLGVYTEIVPGDADLAPILAAYPALSGVPVPGAPDTGRLRGIVLSGSPESVYTPEGAVPDRRIYECGLPMLGICYGLQRMNYDNGGGIEPLPKREYGGIGVTVSRNVLFPEGGGFTAWMSHGDTLTSLAPGFEQAWTSATGYPAVLIHREKPWFGLQFHPEVTTARALLKTLCKSWRLRTYEGAHRRRA